MEIEEPHDSKVEMLEMFEKRKRVSVVVVH